MPLGSAITEIPKYLPDLAANYTKRFLERGYDQIFQTRFGHWLLGLSPWKKYSLEMILYIITAVLDERLPAESALRKYAKQVAFDAAPEISKRMINGAREDIEALIATARNPEEKEFLSVVLSLEDGDIAGLIQWLGRTKLEQKSILRQLSRFSEEQRQKFLRLSEENREKLVEFFSPKEKEESGPAESTFGQVLRQDMVQGAERLREIKERMRQKRKRGRQ